jgi:hypothetical protein
LGLLLKFINETKAAFNTDRECVHKVPWKSFELSEDEQKHDKTRPKKWSKKSATTMIHLKENNKCMTHLPRQSSNLSEYTKPEGKQEHE